MARGKSCKREAPLKADYVLFYKPNKPIAIIEAKDNKHTMSDGMQQALAPSCAHAGTESGRSPNPLKKQGFSTLLYFGIYKQ